MPYTLGKQALDRPYSILAMCDECEAVEECAAPETPSGWYGESRPQAVVDGQEVYAWILFCPECMAEIGTRNEQEIYDVPDFNAP